MDSQNDAITVKKGSQDDAIALRRAQVSQMRLARRTIREIAAALNVSLATVHKDLTAVREEWAERREQNYNDWVAEELALLDRLQRTLLPKAVEGDDRAIHRILNVMDRRARMLGLDQPERFTVQVVTIDMIDAEIARLERELEQSAGSQMLELGPGDVQDDDEIIDTEQ